MEALENDNCMKLVGEGLFGTDLEEYQEKEDRLINLPVRGMQAWKSEMYFVCLWNNKSTLFLESPTLSEQLCVEGSSENLLLNKYELNFRGSIVNVFLFLEKSWFALDSIGSVYSVSTTSTITNDSIDHMEIEDIFDSSPPSKQTKKWSESLVRKIDCNTLIAACLMSNHIAILVHKDGCMMVIMFEGSEFKPRAVVNLEPFCSPIDQLKLEESVISSCSIAALSPSLKELFKDNLDVMSRNIVAVGMPSGVVLWFSPESPERGPVVLCCSSLPLQAIHWIPDGETVDYLAILMSSGRVIIFGKRQQTTLSLPDNVVASCSFASGIVTTNRVDCYACHLKLGTELTLDCVLIPIKGVCSFTRIPDSELMLAATVHGSLYSFNPTVIPSQKSSQFVIPPQTILDNMFTQTQKLEEIYRQMSLEDEMLKAISIASVANSLPSLFTVKIQVLSDDEFTILVKTLDLRFIPELWMGCVVVVRSGGTSDTSVSRLKQDLAKESELAMTVRHKLCVGDVVRAELMCSMQQQAPLLTVALPEVNIDPSYLLGSTITSIQSTSKEVLKEILFNFTNETGKTKPQGCKVSIQIPDVFVHSFFSSVLHNCKHNISGLEWDKLEGGKKCNTKLYLQNDSMVLNLDKNLRELNIDCTSVHLCHQLKEFILQKIHNTNDKQLSEDLVLDIQGVYQQFEIEVMKDQPDMELLYFFRNKLRSSISPLLPA